MGMAALAVTLTKGYVNYASNNGYSSYQSAASMPYGGSGYTNYNVVRNLASSYYNPYASTNTYNPYASTNTYNPYASTNTYNPYASKNTYNPYANTNTYNPYAGNGYSTNQASAYVPSTSFVGSTLANQYLAASTSTQTTGNVCPTTTSRLIIVSDYIKYGTAQTYPCIGSCVFQPNVVLDNIGTLNYDKADVVVLMIGPYSYPHTASQVLGNATSLAAFAAQTNLYLSTIPVRPTVNDATVLQQTAAANALVRLAAAATPAASLLDYQSFYNTYVRYNESQWGGVQMCNWLREQIPTPTSVTAVSPATPIAGTLAPF